ncbi:MAG: hypothetical protein FJY88_05930 [Candidatus Eisenbacteria bacterium]|nr:hypothetical protein [Candidatus Eisenbacteria bacterium]
MSFVRTARHEASILLIAAIPLLAPAASRAQDPTVPSPIRDALAAVDLAPERLRLDLLDMSLWGGDRWKLPLFDALTQRPLRIPGDVEILQRQLLRAAERPGDIYMAATSRLGTGVRRGLIGDPAEELRASLPERDPLPAALRALWKSARKPMIPEDEELIRSAAAQLPDSLDLALAIWVTAAARAIDARHAAFASLGPNAEASLQRDAIAYLLGTAADAQDPASQRRLEERAGAIDQAVWNAGISDLLIAVERTLPIVRRHSAGMGRSWRVATPCGPIVLAGEGPDRHGPESPLILIDAGGDDWYAGGGAGTHETPVSILIDLQGNDRYLAADTLGPAFGAGVAGVGLLIDLAGDDAYRGGHLCMGAGLCGAGVLIDGAGEDRYDALTASQGAGLFGVGILSDLAGRDSYRAFQQSQGYGYVRGAGVLVDRSGDDIYEADDQRIRYPAAQTEEHNASLSQGFGFGKRADFVDGRSLAGGLGVLADGEGDDTYRCGVFGQGCGYWYGIGILADQSGNDSYEGIWYVQGSGAHFALGVLWDTAGEDRYRATMNMAQGAGHDFSLGFLYEGAGDDRYDAPNLSLGGGNANGIGIFWDLTGDDTYSVTAATSLGRANTDSRGGLRDRIDTIGLFLDTGGRDAYPTEKAFAGDGRLWTQPGLNEAIPLDAERGAGVDTTWTPGAERRWRGVGNR